MADCPACGFAGGDGVDCPRCGIVFARYRGRNAARARLARETAAALAMQPEIADVPTLPSPAPPVLFESSGPTAGRAPTIAREGWLCFGGGFAVALLVFAFPFLRAVLSTFVTLVHEMGHAAAGWIFGYPSIPAFDFTYGGGVTLQQDRALWILAAVAGAYGLLVHRAWEDTRLRFVLIGIFAGYAVVAATRAHEAVIVAMGHGAELAFATLALHRALSGRGLRIPAERPLYGFLGWFIVLSCAVFAYELVTSEFHREMYEEAKGGGHWMDFSRLSAEFLGVSLRTVAAGFLALCVLPPLASVWIARRLASAD